MSKIHLTPEEKIQCYSRQINEFETRELKEVLKRVIAVTPSVVFLLPASSSGKYHPSTSHGLSGLLRHQIAAYEIGKSMLRNDTFLNAIGLDRNKMSREDIEIMLGAILIHDNAKYGTEEHSEEQLNSDNKLTTNGNHPVLIYELFQKAGIREMDEHSITIANKLLKLISSHMGQWNTGRSIDTPLPTPESPEQIFVHICDYIAGQKMFDIVAPITVENNDARDDFLYRQVGYRASSQVQPTVSATSQPIQEEVKMITDKQINFILKLCKKVPTHETIVADVMGRPIMDWERERTNPSVDRTKASIIINKLLQASNQ